MMVVLSATAIWGYAYPSSLWRWWQSVKISLEDSYQAESDSSGNSEEVGTDRDETPPNVNPLSLSGADAVLVVESDRFFTAEGAQALRHVVAELEALDFVRNVMWMDRIPELNLFGLPEPLFPRTEASAQRYADTREKARRNPLIHGQLLSADGRTTLLLVSFDMLFIKDDQTCTAGLRQAAAAAAAKFPEVPMKFSVTGRVPMYVAARQAHEANKIRYQIIGYGMVFLMALFLFRGISAVLVVAIAPILGVFWTLGVIRLWDFHDNPFNDVILPVLLSLVGLTDGVHLMVQVRKLRSAGASTMQAVRQGVQQVGLACGLTSLTTAVGFGSLSLAHHEVVRDFGWCCVIGVLLTFLSVVTSIPLACMTRLGHYVQVGQERSLIDKYLGQISGLINVVLRYSRLISYTAVLPTLLLVVASLQLRPDERTANSLPDGCEPAVTMRYLDHAMGGLEFSFVRIQWQPAVQSDSREVLDVIENVNEALLEEELIGHPLSLSNLLATLPGDRHASNRMVMLELLPPQLKRAFYTPETRQASVSFRVQDLGIARYGPVFQRIDQRLQQIMQDHPAFTLDLDGRAVWRWENLYQIVVDLAKSLGTASVIIFGVLAIVYRSARLGLIAVVPNVFPLALAGAFLYVTGQALEIVSVLSFTVCLGIAVDDTIHFLTRFQDEQRRTDDRQEAIRRAFTGVGTALIMTTLVLLAGFATVAYSDSRDHRIFASMGAITIAAALFADLVFLPALLARFAPNLPESERGIGQ
ncbi:MAG: MMPL family transporter [Planctomycetales bacterium]|nr:MMPL family transporter [Planctomycetales bacterium]